MMACTKGDTMACDAEGSGVLRSQWCCACFAQACDHDECRKPMLRTSTREHATMVYVDGSSSAFRCDCGANVFTRSGANKFQCNGCQATYTGCRE